MTFVPREWTERAGDPNARFDAAAARDLEVRLSGYTDAQRAEHEAAADPHGDGLRAFAVAPAAVNGTTGQALGPSAIYDPVSDRTYIAFHGPRRDAYVTYFDHATRRRATPVKVGSYVATVTRDDAHGVPVVVLDGDGYLHVVWYAHSTQLQHAKSAAPRSISGVWTQRDVPTTEVPAGTYPSAVYDATTEAIYVLVRGGTGHGSVYPVHEHGVLVRLPDGAGAWEDVRPWDGSTAGLIDTVAHPDAFSEPYTPKLSRLPSGELLFTWCIAHGTVHDDVRANVYAAKLDLAADKCYTLAGTDLGRNVTWADHAACEVFAADAAGGASNPNQVDNVEHLVLDNGHVLILFPHRVDAVTAAMRCARWDGNAWAVVDTGARTPSTDGATATAWQDGARIEALFAINDHLERWASDDEGVTWAFVERIVAKQDTEGVAGVGGVSTVRDCRAGLRAFWQPWSANWILAELALYAVGEGRAPEGLALVPGQQRTFQLADVITVINSAGGTRNAWQPVDLAGIVDSKVKAVRFDVIVTGDGAAAGPIPINFRPGDAADAANPIDESVRVHARREFGTTVHTPPMLRLSGSQKFEWFIATGATPITNITVRLLEVRVN